MDRYERAKEAAKRYSWAMVLPCAEQQALSRWVLSPIVDLEGGALDCWVAWWVERATAHYNLEALAPWKAWAIPIPPNTDPQVTGQVWNNNGVLTMSAGPNR